MAVQDRTEPTEASPLRPNSYILISSSAPEHESIEPSYAGNYLQQQQQQQPRRRPRLFMLLPLLALIDVAVSVALSVLIMQQELRHRRHELSGTAPTTFNFALPSLLQRSNDNHPIEDPREAASLERTKILLAVMAFSFARTCAYAIVGFSKRIREQGVTVAAISIMSTLFYVSVANLLFQARSKPDTSPPNLMFYSHHVQSSSQWPWPYDSVRHFQPTMPILISIEIAFTLLEWIVYIAVVGVKIPPGGNPVKAKRWARNLARDPSYQHGVEAESLYASEPEDNDAGSEQQDDHEHLHDTHAQQDMSRKQASQGATSTNEASTSPDGLTVPTYSTSAHAGDSSAPLSPEQHARDYGTMATDPRTPQSDHSVRSYRSARHHAQLQQMSRSGSRRSDLYARSPSTAELGAGADDGAGDGGDDSMESSGLGHDGGDETGEIGEDSDPDDIIDITPNRNVAQQEARLRLARAALPERRASGGTLATLNLFGGSQLAPTRSRQQDGSAHPQQAGYGGTSVFATDAGSPIAPGRRDLGGGILDGGSGSRHSSASFGAALSSSGIATPSSSRASTTGKEKKFKLPKWMKPGRKNTVHMYRCNTVSASHLHPSSIVKACVRRHFYLNLLRSSLRFAFLSCLSTSPTVLNLLLINNTSHFQGFPPPLPSLSTISFLAPSRSAPLLSRASRAIPRRSVAPTSSATACSFSTRSAAPAKLSRSTGISPSSRVSVASTRLSAATNHLTAGRFSTSSNAAMPPLPKPSSTHYDMVVIGGGSGAMGASRRAAAYGKKVCVIEEDGRLGGTCVNVGCVPKKIMWHAADMAEHLKEAPEYGFGDVDNRPSIPDFSWNYFAEKRDAYVRRLNGIYDRNLGNDGVEYLSGHGKLTGPKEVEVTMRGEDGKFDAGTFKVTGDHIVIATGGRPIIPSDDKIPGASLGINSDGFFALREQPKRVVVVGAGYIAVELAGVFNSLGSETHLLIRHDKFLRNFDPIISDTLQDYMGKTGLQVHAQTNITKVEGGNGGPLTIHTDKGDKIEADCLLWAVGRRPNTDNLGLETAGIELDKAGNIVVDKYQETNVKDVFAIGDIQGKALLTPVAIAAGRKLSNRLYGHPSLKDDHMDYDNIPTVIFSHPTSGTVGLSEVKAQEMHGEENVKVHNSKFVSMYYGMLEHKAPSAFKIITAGKEDRVVGLHMVGLGADEMLQGFAVAVKMRATIKDFQETCAIHPTSAEEVVTMVPTTIKP
ncbi:hypothetical protein BCV70DRAFT_163219 [Testicularia cyperi]|uniref:Glutathione reductase n=1 Tax=Testicularia cyperi TaxID=1882483 RepID=A0A317XLC7_9BASI|nr:hypothetical protein BCV70DRAFT_163219 [Testicularia cyperi]